VDQGLRHGGAPYTADGRCHVRAATDHRSNDPAL